MTDKKDTLLALLRTAVCPMKANGCDGTQYPVPPDGEAEQCQWCYERGAAIKALAEQPAPPAVSVDLERFRLPVEAWQSRLDPDDAEEADLFTEADNLLALIDSAGGAKCGCGLATCVEPWEPGCGLGNSEEHATVADEEEHD